MGRKKIKIEKITDERNRQVTFTKRKNGLYKKAMELSLLCDCDVTLIIFPKNGRLYQYSSSNVGAVFRRVTEATDIAEAKSNDDYVPLCKKLGGDSGDEHHDGSSQSPGREDKPPKMTRVNPQSESASYKPHTETHTAPAPPSQPRNPVERISHPDFLSSDSHIVSSFGLRNDPLVYNLTPKTEKRYEEINKTFEVALKSTNAQYEPNQMHPYPQAQQLAGAVSVIPPIASVPIISPITSMPTGNMGSYNYPLLQDNYAASLADRNRIPDINRYPFTYAQNPGNYTVLPEPRGHYPPTQPNDMNMTLPNLALEPQVEPQEPKRQNATDPSATNGTTQTAAPTGRTSLKARRSFGRGDLSLPTQPQSLSGGGNNSANSADFHHPFQGEQPLPTPESSKPLDAEDRFILPVPISSMMKPPDNMNKEHIVLFSPTSMHPIWPGMKPERVDPLPQMSHQPGSNYNQGGSFQGWNASEERNPSAQRPIPTTSEQSAKTNERDM